MILYKKYKDISGRFSLYLNLMPESKGIILDIGCDKGAFSSSYLHYNKASKVIGVDVDSENIKFANNTYVRKNLEFISYDGANLPFSDEYFDAITATEVLEHVVNEKDFLLELHRVLKNKGVLLLSVPNKGLWDILDVFNFRYILPNNVFVFFYKAVTGNIPIDEPNRVWHKHYKKKELLKSLFEASFEVNIVKRKGFLFYYLIWIYNDLIFPKMNNSFGKILKKIIAFFADVEYLFGFGSFSSNLVILCKKK